VAAPVVVLAGGTGGAKLARGMLDVARSDLVVIANTADDVEVYGAYVSPDPDLVLWWLADRIDDRGWGLRGDTFEVMDGLRELGDDVWFHLGDRDLAACLRRRRRLDEGASLSQALDELRGALGVPARVVPMSDSPVRTRVRHDGRWWPLQEFLIRAGGKAPVTGVEYEGVAAASPAPGAVAALRDARAVVIGPSNPVISIGPILAVPGMREAIADSPAPVVAVSPLVGGEVLKGPTAAFMEWAGRPLDASGIAATYDGLIDGLVADDRTNAVPTLLTDVLMDGATGRERLAAETLRFAEALS
jgi:LPPG:FO 2-phospho-L-lactate transferase